MEITSKVAFLYLWHTERAIIT